MKIDYEAGIVREGNTKRLLEVFQKAEEGREITLAFLGGSITQGARSSSWQTCYAYLTYAWFVKTFPKAKVNYINAGIGGTTSHLGAGRVEEDVLSHKPDFVIVEFSVNDEDTSDHFMESYEGLVRHILSDPGKPALMLVHNVRYDDGGNAEAIHLPIGDHYNLPAVTMKKTILPLVKEQGIDNRELTEDDLHPNDLGHDLVSRVICYYLEKCRREQFGSREEPKMPLPLTKNRYETCIRKKADRLNIVENRDFCRDTGISQGTWDCFKGGLYSRKKGAELVIRERFSNLAVQYRKTVRKPAPVASLILDGDTDNAIILDANFDQDWGDCLYLETIAEDLEDRDHEVRIVLVETGKQDKEDFYLVSLITS